MEQITQNFQNSIDFRRPAVVYCSYGKRRSGPLFFSIFFKFLLAIHSNMLYNQRLNELSLLLPMARAIVQKEV